MSNNPFETSQAALHTAAKIAGINPDAVRYLEQPKRIFQFTIPMKMDNGALKFFEAYRVHYNDALGQVKNGLRFVPDLDLDIVKALGLWMTVKHAVAGIPAGGGKGGVKVDPKTLSEGEYERLCRAYIRKLPMKGAWVDVPGADIGTSGKTMAWMLDELEEIKQYHQPAAINDKPVATNGTQLSMEATGTGVFFVTREAVKDLGIASDAKIVVQGFGNVGRTAALLYQEAGFKVVGVGDIKNAIYNEDGIDIPALVEHVAKTGYVEGFPGTKSLSNAELLELPCDILVPAAVQSVLNEGNADKIQAKLIMEAANGPTTPEAEEILAKRGIAIVPDVLTNCGSAIVCSFERTQGLTDDYWDVDKVRNKLEERIVSAYRATKASAEKYDTSMRNGAWINALKKIADSMTARGWI